MPFLKPYPQLQEQTDPITGLELVALSEDNPSATLKVVTVNDLGDFFGNGLSPSLEALGALTPAADRLPYFDSVSTAALTPFTSFARSLLDDANASTARATLGAAASGANTDITSIAGSAATLTTGRTIAITGDLAYTSPSFNGSGNVTAAGTLATVNSNVGTFGDSSNAVRITVNAKGLVTAVTTQPITGGGIALPLAVADGGTGATTASGARTNLGLGTAATQAYTATTFTPTFSAAGTPPTGVTYNAGATYGRARQIADQVFFQLGIVVTSIGSGGAGNVQIIMTGLPNAALATAFSPGLVDFIGLPANTVPTLTMAAGGVILELRSQSNTTNQAVMYGAVSNNFTVRMTGSYIV